MNFFSSIIKKPGPPTTGQSPASLGSEQMVLGHKDQLDSSGSDDPDSERLSPRTSMSPGRLEQMLFNQLSNGMLDPILEEYSSHKIPPNFELARKHGRANLAGSFSNHILNPKTDQSGEVSTMKLLSKFLVSNKAINSREEERKHLCACCDRKDPEGQLGMIPLMRSSYNFAKIGFAVPLYFDYIKLLLGISVGMFLLMGIYQMIVYSADDECRYKESNSDYCGSRWMFLPSRANAGHEYIYSVTNHILFVISVVFLYTIRLYYSYRFTKKTISADQRFIDITDYTVKMMDLPLDTTKQEIKEFFSNISMETDSRSVPLEVAEVNFVYHNYSELTKADEGLTKTLKKYREEFLSHDKANLQTLRSDFNHQRRKAVDLVVEKFSQGGDINRGLLRKRHQHKIETQGKNEHFSGVAYVSFQTEEMASYAETCLKISNIPKWAWKNLGRVPLWMYKLPGGKRHLFRTGVYVHLDKAQPPQDVVWENMGPQSMNALSRKAINICFSLVIMVISFLVLLWLKNVQQNLKGSFWVTLLLTLIIKVLNKIAVFVYKQMVKLERIDSLTLEYVTSTSRMAILTFTNSVIMLIVLNLIVAGSVSELRKQILGDQGLAKDLFFMILFSFIDLIGALVSFKMAIKIWSRQRNVKKADDCVLEQWEANELFEGFEFVFSDRLTKYCKVITLLFFMVHFFPITPVFALVYLPVYFWVDKYFLLRLATIPKFCTEQLGHSMLRFLDFAFIIYTFGRLVIESLASNYVSWVTVLMFVLSILIFLANPGFFINKYVLGMELQGMGKTNKLQFEMAKSSFHRNTYEFCNPVNSIKQRLLLYSTKEFFDLREKYMQKFIKNTLFDIEGLLKKQTGSQHSQQDEVDEVGSQLPEEHEAKVQVVEEVRIVEAKPPAKQITSSSVATDPHTWLGKISKYWTKKDPEDQTASVTQSQGGQSTTLKGWVSPQQTTTSLLDFKSAFTKEEVESMIQSHAKDWRRPWASNNLITQVSNSK